MPVLRKGNVAGCIMNKLISRLMRSLRRQHPSGDQPAGSRFETYDFGEERFECTISSFSGTGACHDLYLNRYDHGEISELLQRIGLLDFLRGKGISRPLVQIDRSPEHMHYLKIYQGRATPGRLLIDLRLSQMIYSPEERLVRGIIRERQYKALAVEWLTLQDPRGRFTPEHPRLPGQNRPGLGAVRHIAQLLELFARDLSADTVLDVPEQFHAAVMYSRKFSFMDPAREGMMRAVLRDLGSHPLADLSWGFVTGTIADRKTGEPVAYRPSEQLLPMAESLGRYFASREYRRRVSGVMEKLRVVFDRDRMIQMRNAHPDYSN